MTEADMTENPSALQGGPSRRLFTVRQIAERHAWASEPALRSLIFRSDTNGLCRAIRRVGRRVLFDEAEFLAWIEGQNSGEAD